MTEYTVVINITIYPDQGNLKADEDEGGVISTRALAEFGFTIHHYLLKTTS